MPTQQDYESFDTPAPAKVPASTGATPIIGGRPQVTVNPLPRGVTQEDYEPFTIDETARTTSPSYREVGIPEAAARGYIDWSTMGLGPALMGAGAAGAAGKTEEQQQAEIQPGTEYPGGEMVGEGIHRAWAGHPAYEQGRQSFLNDDRMAQDQNYVPYVLGQVTAALSAPGTIAGNMMRTATRFIPRLAQSMLQAGARTGMQSAGEAISEGRPEEAPLEAAKGVASGAALAGIGGVTLEGATSVARKVGTIIRGAKEATRDAEAGRKVVDALTADIGRFGSSMTPEEQAAAQAAGTPLAIMDVGGEQTRKLVRSAANLSPEGRQVLQDFTQSRFRQQGSRAADFTRNLMNISSTRDQDVIDAAKAAFNPPMYRRAYQAGDRPIWSPEMERLAGDPDLIKAIGKAAKTGKSWAIFDGMGGFNPSVRVTEDGQLVFNRGPTGVPTYPNIQFWDYVQRELKGAIDETRNSADRTRMGSLRRSLLKELDDQVPEFGQARETASNFFGAENAVEAGENFVMTKGHDLAGAARALSGMKPVERELFARAFASDLANKFEDIRYNTDALNQAFIESPTARNKINLALGRDRANQLEAFLRVENVVDKARKALGNSTTVRQAHELEAAGGAVGAAESLKSMSMPGILLTGLGIVKGRKMLAGIDEKVAQRVAEMLVSDDPAVLQKGIQIISKSPTWMRVLRQATGVSAKVAAQDLGFTNLAGGATFAAEEIGDIFKHHEKEEPHHETENLQYQDQTQ